MTVSWLSISGPCRAPRTDPPVLENQARPITFVLLVSPPPPSQRFDINSLPGAIKAHVPQEPFGISGSRLLAASDDSRVQSAVSTIQKESASREP